MNQENIDKIFIDGLNAPEKFEKEEQQWKVVQSKLNASNRKKIIWMWFLGLSLMAFLMVTILISRKPDIQNQLVNNNIQKKLPDAIKSVAKNSLNQDSTVSLAPSKDIHSAISESKPSTLQKTKYSPIPVKPATPAISLGKIEPIFNQTNYPINSIYNDKYSEDRHNASFTSETNTYNDSSTIVHQLHAKNMAINTLGDVQPTASISLIFSPLEFSRSPIKIEDEKIKTFVGQKNKSSVFSIVIGTTTDFIGSELTSDSREYSTHFEFNVSPFSNTSFSVGYSSRKINRNLGQNHDLFNVPMLTNPYQPELFNTTKLQYFNKSIDLNFDYRVWNNHFSKLSVGIGTQVNKNKMQNLIYIYEDQYSVYEEEITAEEQNWHFSDLMASANIEIPISRRFSITSRYQYHWPISNTNYQWPNRHRVVLGMLYKLKM